MAFTTGTSGDDDGFAAMSDINVTPFIDVILVLLVVFMIAAPLSTVDIPVDLPAASATVPSRPDKPVFVTLKADLTLAVGEQPAQRGNLADTVDAATGNDNTVRLFVRADKSVPYGEIIGIFNELRAGGYLKVALVALDGNAGSQ